MIWDILQESSFNNYFQSPQTLTVQTLLLDENIITELKNLNPKLIDQQTIQLIQYSIQSHKDEFISKLIHYVIVLPHENDSEDRIKKLPYVSSEVLAIDNSIIYKAFLDEGQKDYFAELIKILQTSSAQNQILLGYFVKVIENLYKCQKKLVNHFQQQTDGQKNIPIQGHFLQKSQQVINRNKQTQQAFMINERKQVIEQVIKKLVSQEQIIKNVCKNILADVIYRFQTFSSGDELLNYITSSEELLKIYEIKNSQSIDEYIIEYLVKALQKICTSGEGQTNLIKIPQNHKLKIKQHINSKKNILNNNKNLKQNSCFLNQSGKKVYKFDPQLSTYLTLIKLSLQNWIVGFLTEEDIISLFNILQMHPTNDIVKVKIFEIFNLIYSKKDEKSKEIFQKFYFLKSIELFNQDKQMFGYFLYNLWKYISKKIIKDVSSVLQPTDIQKWNELMKYFQMSQKYQKQAQKVIDMYSNRTKVIKLVVDQEDSASPKQNIENIENGGLSEQRTIKKQQEKLNVDIQNLKISQKTQNINYINQPQKQQKKIDASFNPFDDFFTKTPIQTKTQNKKQAIKSDPFAAFDFFDTKKEEKKEQKKPQQKLKPNFSDFGSFF